MAISTDLYLRGLSGVVRGTTTLHTIAALDATVTQITLPTVQEHQFGSALIRCIFKNGHASQFIAWQVVPHGNAKPTFVASFTASTAGNIVLANSEKTHLIDAGLDLYVIASGSSTPFQVSMEIIQ